MTVGDIDQPITWCTAHRQVLYNPGHVQKDAVGRLGQAGLLEGCSQQEDVREGSEPKPRVAPAPVHPPALARLQEEETTEQKRCWWNQGGVEVARGWQPCEVARGASGQLR